MDRKTYDVIQSVGGYEEFKQLVQRGRQMHNQAVSDLFARLVSNIVLFVKKTLVSQSEGKARRTIAKGHT